MNRRSLIMLPLIALLLAAITISLPHDARTANAGIPTVLLPIASSPLITFRIQFRAGAADDPEGKKGLTELTADMLTEGGTTKHSYEEITALLYPMASSVNAIVDKDVTTFVGTTHIDNLDRYLDLFLQVLLEPRFDARDFDRLRTNQKSYLENTLRGANDEELGKQSLNTFMYAGHPYGYPDQGLASNLDAITLDDVKAHYAKMFTRANVTIGLAGGYPKDLAGKVSKALEKLPATAPAHAAHPATRPISGIEVLAVEKDTRSTAISIGFPIDVTRADADFYALMVANSHLGEHRTMNGVLMNRMREVRGLNYGDYSYIEHFVQDGGTTFPITNIPRSEQYFSIWIRPVQPQHRQFALRLALFELNRLVTDGMTQAQFEEARSFVKNYSKLWAQDQGRRLGYLMDSRFYGMDDFLGTLPAKLDALTLDQVNAAIKKHLRSDNLKVAVVTKGAEAFLNDVANNTPSPIVYEAEGIPQAVIDEDKVVAVYKINVNKAASKVVNVAEMFK
ncbi:MAG TPA: pitrilysin family protein [Candidatus Krumholzibacteria bacterium]